MINCEFEQKFGSCSLVGREIGSEKLGSWISSWGDVGGGVSASEPEWQFEFCAMHSEHNCHPHVLAGSKTRSVRIRSLINNTICVSILIVISPRH